MQTNNFLLFKKFKNTESAQLCKQMLQAANTDLSNPLVPKAHNSVKKNCYKKRRKLTNIECQYLGKEFLSCLFNII